MSTAEILLLGALAGCTIFIGLPVARLRNVSPAARSLLAAIATGILIFLLWDVLTNAVEPVEGALEAGHDGRFSGSRRCSPSASPSACCRSSTTTRG